MPNLATRPQSETDDLPDRHLNFQTRRNAELNKNNFDICIYL